MSKEYGNINILKHVDSYLKSINHKSSDILTIFLLGSRLWQTNNEKSDYDIMVILNSKLKVINDPTSTHINSSKYKIDLTIMSEMMYINRISEGRFLEFVTLFMPNHNIVFGQRLDNHIKYIDNKTLINKTLQDCKDSMVIIRKFINRKVFDIAIKKIIHLIRMTHLVNKYVSNKEKCIDLTLGKDLYTYYVVNRGDYTFEYNWTSIKEKLIIPYLNVNMSELTELEVWT